jgi:lipoyl(octanoyl) transferase
LISSDSNDAAPARRLDDPALAGAVNMARDEALLATRAVPTLRFYRWAKPTLSLGYFQAADSLPLDQYRAEGTDILRRDTGGKAILHDRELTYALCAPETGPLAGGPAAAMQTIHIALAAELTRQVHEAISIRAETILLSDRPGSAWCFEDSSPLDLAMRGRKLLGSAARRRDGWVLFHGSLVLEAPPQTAEIAAFGQEPNRDGLARALGHCLGYDFALGNWTNDEFAAAEQVGARHASCKFVTRR